VVDIVVVVLEVVEVTAVVEVVVDDEVVVVVLDVATVLKLAGTVGPAVGPALESAAQPIRT
jgi:hypothetical protein